MSTTCWKLNVERCQPSNFMRQSLQISMTTTIYNPFAFLLPLIILGLFLVFVFHPLSAPTLPAVFAPLCASLQSWRAWSRLSGSSLSLKSIFVSCTLWLSGIGLQAFLERGVSSGRLTGPRLKLHTSFVVVSFTSYWVLAVSWFLLYCFVSNHSLEKCKMIYKIPVGLAMWNQLGAEAVLLIRTYAFFNRNLYLLVALVLSLLGVVTYQLYVTIDAMLLLPFLTPPFTKGPCFPVSKPHEAHVLGFFIAPLAYDTMVTFITVAKAFQIRRLRGGPGTKLVETFIREGVFYYIMISVANLVNGIFYLQPRQAMSAICIPLSVLLAPILACRMILDLRERGSEARARELTPPGPIPPQFNSMSSSQSYPQTPHSTSGLGLMSGNKGSGRNKGQVIVNSRNSRGMTTTITMGTGTLDTVELADLSKDEDDYKVNIGGISGIRVEVEKTSDV